MSELVTQDVFELTLARPAELATGEAPWLVHLWWRAPAQGQRLVQVYVDGQWAAMTDSPNERELWLLMDRSVPHRLELLAVDAMDPEVWSRSWPGSLRGWSGVRDSAHWVWLRDEALPADTKLELLAPEGALASGPLWSAQAHRGGFGAVFGEGGFGYDAATGPGLGLGSLGDGPLGTDGSALEHTMTGLPEGASRVSTRVTATGRLGADAETELEIAHVPEPVRGLERVGDSAVRWER